MTKTGSKLLAIRSLVVVALCATLSSFSENVGVDSFTIYLNNKLLLKEYVTREASVKNISVNGSGANDILKVHYDHCGRTGTNRSLAIQNGQKRELKRWNFSDDASPVMDLGVKELIGFRKDAGHQGLQLVYSSQEIPEGTVLASIILSNASKASLH